MPQRIIYSCLLLLPIQILILLLNLFKLSFSILRVNFFLFKMPKRIIYSCLLLLPIQILILRFALCVFLYFFSLVAAASNKAALRELPRAFFFSSYWKSFVSSISSLTELTASTALRGLFTFSIYFSRRRLPVMSVRAANSIQGLSPLGKAALPLPIATAVTGLAPVCCCAVLRQSCLVVYLIASLVHH